MMPLSTALHRSPASIPACSLESTISLSARAIVASSTSRARHVVGPAPIKVAPSFIHVPSITGSIVAAMHRTMSQSRTAFSLLDSEETSIPIESDIRPAKSSRRSELREYALILVILRTFDTASS